MLRWIGSLAMAFCLIGGTVRAEEATIGREVAFGCQNPFAYGTVAQFASDGDTAAAKRLLRYLFFAGDCVRFHTGERVFVDGRAEPWVRIRRPGQIAAYWIASDDIWSRWP